MELRFRGLFNRDIDKHDRELLDEVKKAILNVRRAKTISQIHHLKKLRKYKTHYRIRVAEDFRIGVVIRRNTIWFVRFGHRNSFYKGFP